jgi:hypothetical protein
VTPVHQQIAALGRYRCHHHDPARLPLSLELMQPSILSRLLTTTISYSFFDRNTQLLAQTRVKQEFSEPSLSNTFCDNSRLAARPSRSLMTRAIRIKCPKREAGHAKNAVRLEPCGTRYQPSWRSIVSHLDLSVCLVSFCIFSSRSVRLCGLCETSGIGSRRTKH